MDKERNKAPEQQDTYAQTAGPQYDPMQAETLGPGGLGGERGLRPSSPIREQALKLHWAGVNAERDRVVADRVLSFVTKHPEIAQFLDDLRELGLLR